MRIQKKLWITNLLVIFCVVIGFSQQHIMGLGEFIDYANIDRANASINNSYEEISGSPFLFEDFTDGKIKLKNGKTYQGPLRYDIYADQIEFKTSEGVIYAVKNPEAMETIIMGDSKFQCFTKESGNAVDGIFEILAEGKFILLEKHKVELKDPVPPKPYVEAKPAGFSTQKSKYLILNPQGDLIQLDSKKDLLAAGTVKKPELGNYIKKNKIKVTNKTDLIEFVNFLNVE